MIVKWKINPSNLDVTFRQLLSISLSNDDVLLSAHEGGHEIFFVHKPSRGKKKSYSHKCKIGMYDKAEINYEY